MPHREVPESRAVDMDHEHERRLQRFASGTAHHQCLGKDVEGTDDTHHEVEQDHRGQQRQRDMPEALPGSGAIDGGRIQERWRDLLQAGQKDQGAGAEPPQAQEDQRRFRPGRVGQPAHCGQSNRLEQGVDESVIGVEHGDKDDGAGNRGDEHGKGDERAIDAHTLRPGIQEQRQAQRAGQTEGNGEQGVIRTVPDRRPERRVGGEHGAVVLQANPPRGLDDVVVGKGQVKRREHRIDGEKQQAAQPWQHKQQPGTGRAAPRSHPAAPAVHEWPP